MSMEIEKTLAPGGCKQVAERRRGMCSNTHKLAYLPRYAPCFDRTVLQLVKVILHTLCIKPIKEMHVSFLTLGVDMKLHSPQAGQLWMANVMFYGATRQPLLYCLTEGLCFALTNSYVGLWRIGETRLHFPVCLFQGARLIQLDRSYAPGQGRILQKAFLGTQYLSVCRLVVYSAMHCDSESISGLSPVLHLNGLAL